jgi:hypothetical protein
VDSVKSGISGEQPGHTETTTSSVLDPPLPQRLTQDVPRDPKQPRQRGHVALLSEPASPQPSPCEDLGCQIGGMLANPRPRPRKHLSSVSVIDLLEPIGSARPQELPVRRPSQLASHNLYLTLPQKMCHACHSFRVLQRPSLDCRAPSPTPTLKPTKLLLRANPLGCVHSARDRRSPSLGRRWPQRADPPRWNADDCLHKPLPID